MDYESLNPREYYQENGYYVFRNSIPHEKIDALLDRYRSEIVPSEAPFFRQSSNCWEKNVFNEHGYALNSLLDIHDYEGEFATFSDIAKDIYADTNVLDAISAASGHKVHHLMQSMFFDMNAATPPHQDCYYLDTIPAGELFGVWFALEDIHEEAGRFLVMPGTHKIDFKLSKDEDVSNEPYLKMIDSYVAESKDNIVTPALNKGDILIWNSKTIHGSLAVQNSRYSRKSLTAHYIPAGYQFGNSRGVPFPVEYGEYQGLKYRKTNRIYSPMKNMNYKAQNFLHRHPKIRRIINGIRGSL